MSLEDQVNALATEIASEIKELRAAIEQRAPLRPTVKGADYPAYTFTAEDAGCIVIAGSSLGMTTLTIPIDVFTEGDRIDVVGLGGQATFVAGSGLVLDPPAPVLRAKWSSASVVFLSPIQAVVVGDLAS